MLLYLVQHGKAKSKEEDPNRPLTDEGRREVDAVMLLMLRYGAITASRVIHSGKLRAGETAQLIGSRIDVAVEESDGLHPNDDPGIWEERLAEEDGQDILLVGHMPHLSRLASKLLCGDPEAGLVDFANGGIVCLNGEGGHWALHWSVPPSLVQ